MKCKKCDTIVLNNVKFCPQCGEKIKRVNIRKIILIIIPCIILILGSLLVFKNFSSKEEGYSEKESYKEVSYHYENNIPKYITGAFSAQKVKSENDAKKVLKDLLKIEENNIELVSQLKNEDITYYKFAQTYQEIPVYNQNIILSVDSNDNILGYSGYYVPNVKVNVNANISKDEVEEIVKEKLGENAKIVNNELNILAEDNTSKLVYIIDGYSDNDMKKYLIDAEDGEILNEIVPIDYIEMTLEGMDNKKCNIDIENYDVMGEKYYKFYDAKRKISVADLRGTSQLTSMVTALPGSNAYDINESSINDGFSKVAVSSMEAFEKIYDYYKNVLNRNSYDDKGSPIIVNLGIKNSLLLGGGELANAYWLSTTNQMYIGEYNGKYFSASLDVLAHEFTHGVNQHIVNFAKSPKSEDINKAFETRALDEAYADILGSLIEGENWTIAEDNEILRNLADPNSLENPSEVGGKYYIPDGYIREGENDVSGFLERNNLKNVYDYDTGGVHQNANVVGHAAYLMESYGAFKDKKEMAKVWYQSLFYLPSYAKFEDCALAVIQAAKNLGLGNDSISKITKAFLETNMLGNEKNILKGNIKSGEKLISDATIEIYSYDNNELINSTKSDDNGNYELELESGVYKIVVKKDKFNEYNGSIVVDGEVIYDIELARIIKKKVVDSESKEYDFNCKNNCVTIKMCYSFDMYNMVDENCNELKVEKGSIVSAQNIVDTFNKNISNIEGMENYSSKMTTDGENFYMEVAGFNMEFAWYYKGKQEKFNWNKPINEDTEIEMKYTEQDFFGSDTYEDVEDLLDLFGY